MSLVRNVVVRTATPLRRSTSRPLQHHATALAVPYISLPSRSYASKAKNKDRARDSSARDVDAGKVVSTDELVPGSQRIVQSPEYVKAEGKMKAALDFFRKEVAALEMRASGRVTPAVLSPVKVQLPHAQGQGVRLEEVATVGVRDGSMLIVTVFEEQTLKYVEKAIYDAKLPGVTPQKADARTIRIPIPKPTVEARIALFGTAQRQAEDARSQIRRQRDAVAKGLRKRDPEYDEYQKLMDRYIGDVDKILADLKKTTGAK